METLETNLVFPDKNIKTKSTKSVANNSYTIEYSMTNKDKLKIIKKWYEDYKNTKTFNLYLKYNEKTYNLYSFSLKGGNINIYFTYSDESKTYGFGMEVINIDNEFPTFISDTPDFDISTLTKQEETGGTGTNNYDELQNKPSINGVTLQGNLTSEDLNISGNSESNELPYYEYTISTYDLPVGEEFKSIIKTDSKTKALFQEIYDKINNNEKILFCLNAKTVDGSTNKGQGIVILDNSIIFGNTVDIRVGGSFVTKLNQIPIHMDAIIELNMKDGIVSSVTFLKLYEMRTFVYNNYMKQNSYTRDVMTLTTTNTIVYEPTEDYHPSTKKYVDDLVGNIQTLLEEI